MFNCCSDAVPPSSLASSTPQLHFLCSGPTTLILPHTLRIYFLLYLHMLLHILPWFSLPLGFSVTVSINLALRPCSRWTFSRRTSVFPAETSFPNLRAEVSILVPYFRSAAERIIFTLQLDSSNVNYYNFCPDQTAKNYSIWKIEQNCAELLNINNILI